jgi:hypothetical protein
MRIQKQFILFCLIFSFSVLAQNSDIHSLSITLDTGENSVIAINLSDGIRDKENVKKYLQDIPKYESLLKKNPDVRPLFEKELKKNPDVKKKHQECLKLFNADLENPSVEVDKCWNDYIEPKIQAIKFNSSPDKNEESKCDLNVKISPHPKGGFIYEGSYNDSTNYLPHQFKYHDDDGIVVLMAVRNSLAQHAVIKNDVVNLDNERARLLREALEALVVYSNKIKEKYKDCFDDKECVRMADNRDLLIASAKAINEAPELLKQINSGKLNWEAFLGFIQVVSKDRSYLDEMYKENEKDQYQNLCEDAKARCDCEFNNSALRNEYLCYKTNFRANIGLKAQPTSDGKCPFLNYPTFENEKTPNSKPRSNKAQQE